MGFVLVGAAGRSLVRAEPIAGSIAVEPGEDAPDGLALVEAGQEEPWWRILGNPLVAVTEPRTPHGLLLQFRRDDENPRVVSFSLEEGLVSATLKT